MVLWFHHLCGSVALHVLPLNSSRIPCDRAKFGTSHWPKSASSILALLLWPWTCRMSPAVTKEVSTPPRAPTGTHPDLHKSTEPYLLFAKTTARPFRTVPGCRPDPLPPYEGHRTLQAPTVSIHWTAGSVAVDPYATSLTSTRESHESLRVRWLGGPPRYRNRRGKTPIAQTGSRMRREFARQKSTTTQGAGALGLPMA